jgi:hypothetical protein
MKLAWGCAIDPHGEFVEDILKLMRQNGQKM